MDSYNVISVKLKDATVKRKESEVSLDDLDAKPYDSSVKRKEPDVNSENLDVKP